MRARAFSRKEESVTSLRSLVVNDILNRKLQGIEEYVNKELLRFWQVHAPHYTDHGIAHCENIISILERMIPADVKEILMLFSQELQ